MANIKPKVKWDAIQNTFVHVSSQIEEQEEEIEAFGVPTDSNWSWIVAIASIASMLVQTLMLSIYTNSKALFPDIGYNMTQVQNISIFDNKTNVNTLSKYMENPSGLAENYRFMTFGVVIVAAFLIKSEGGCRKCSICFSFVAATTFTAYHFMPNDFPYYAFYGLILIGGGSHGIIMAAAQLIVMIHFSKRKGLATGISSGFGNFFSSILSYNVMNLFVTPETQRKKSNLFTYHGWRTVLLMWAGNAVIAAILSLVYSPLNRNDPERYMSIEAIRSRKEKKPNFFSQIIDLFKNKVFVLYLLAIMFFSYRLGNSDIRRWTNEPPFKNELTKKSIIKSNHLTYVFGSGNMFGTLSLAFITDKLKYLDKFYLSFACLAGSGLTTFLFVFIDQKWPFLTVYFFFSGFTFPFLILIILMSAEIFGMKRIELVFGTYFLTYNLVKLTKTATFMGYSLKDYIEKKHVNCFLSGTLTLVGSAIVLMICYLEQSSQNIENKVVEPVEPVKQPIIEPITKSIKLKHVQLKIPDRGPEKQKSRTSKSKPKSLKLKRGSHTLKHAK